MFTFLQLGVKNARNNMARSVFAIISMVVAAGFLTYSISLSRGYTHLYKADPRSIFGGEVVFFARQFGGVIPAGESSWKHSFLFESPFTDLVSFRPELLESGYLSINEQQTSFSQKEIEEIESALPEVLFVYPRYQLPAIMVDENRRDTPLRGRDASLDDLQARHPRDLISAGRWFNNDDEGKMVAVISDYQKLPEGSIIPMIGDIIKVEVPRLSYIEGEAVFHLQDPYVFEFEVIGQFQAITRYVDFGGGPAPVFWEVSEIQLPFETWQTIWHEIGGQEFLPEELALGFADQSFIEDTVMELRELLPDYTVYSTVEYFGQAENRGLIERMSLQLQERVITEDTQTAMPLDLRVPFTIMIFINAAMVVAANLLIMVNERKTEVGILKSVGSLRSEVIIMIVTEALIITLFGAAIGFVFFAIPSVLNQITNGTRLVSIFRSVLNDFFVVFGTACAFTVIFGMLPGLRTANLPVMEVLRSD